MVRASTKVMLATWFYRHKRAIIVDQDMIQQPGVGAAGTNLQQITSQRLQRLLHLVLGILLEFRNHRFLHQQ